MLDLSYKTTQIKGFVTRGYSATYNTILGTKQMENIAL